MATDDRAPWEVIRAAADKIEKLAGEATPGQWEIEFDYHGKVPQALFRMDPEHPDDPDHSVGLGAMGAPADNVWIATLSPAVAEPLVAWLRDAADATERSFDYWIAIPGWVAAAGDLALKILGEEQG